MDTALIIFTAGTAASFLPLYWLALRLSARWRRPARVAVTRRADPPGRREFLDLLRREAASRAVAVLHEALAEARLTVDRGIDGSIGLSDETCRSLDETRRLVDSLFAGELREMFRRGAEALAAASTSTIGAASVMGTNAIAAFECALDGEAERAGSPQRRAVRSGRVAKGRGWFAGGDVQAAA